jgi:hypothetical protein
MAVYDINSKQLAWYTSITAIIGGTEGCLKRKSPRKRSNLATHLCYQQMDIILRLLTQLVVWFRMSQPEKDRTEKSRDGNRS